MFPSLVNKVFGVSARVIFPWSLTVPDPLLTGRAFSYYPFSSPFGFIMICSLSRNRTCHKRVVHIQAPPQSFPLPTSVQKTPPKASPPIAPPPSKKRARNPVTPHFLFSSTLQFFPSTIILFLLRKRLTPQQLGLFLTKPHGKPSCAIPLSLLRTFPLADLPVLFAFSLLFFSKNMALLNRYTIPNPPPVFPKRSLSPC